MKIKINYFVLLLLTQFCFAQDKIAGIEFSKKFVKTLIIENRNSEKKEFRVRNFWMETVPDSYTSEERNQKIVEIIKQVAYKIRAELNIKDDQVFLLADDFAFTQKEQNFLTLTLKALKFPNVDFSSVLNSSTYLFKGVFKEGYDTSKAVLLNMDNENGYYAGYEVFNGKPIFNGVVIQNSGYTENLEKTTSSNGQTAVFNCQELLASIDDASKMNNLLHTKEEIYLTGDSAWMFFSLMNGGMAVKEYSQFKLNDVEKHQSLLETNYKRYEILSSASIEVEKVLKSHTKNELLMANYLLLNSLRTIKHLSNKKIYYCKNWSNAKLSAYLAAKMFKEE